MADGLYYSLLRDPRYQRAVQRRMAVSPEIRAIPNVRDVAWLYSAGLAREELAGQRHAARMELGRERLDIAREQHAGEMGLARDALDIAKSQGRFATGLSIANLGIQGIAGALRIVDANRRVSALKAMEQEFTNAGDEANAKTARFLRIYYGGY